KRDHRGDGVSRQPEKKFLSRSAENYRLPWPDRGALKIKLRATGPQHRLDKIILPHGDPAGHDDQVGAERLLDQPSQFVFAVGSDPDHPGRGSGRLDQGGERRRAAVSDLMPEGALIQWNQFVAGRKNGNPRLAKNPHRHSSNSREQANFRRAKPTAAPENHVARPRLASLA